MKQKPVAYLETLKSDPVIMSRREAGMKLYGAYDTSVIALVQQRLAKSARQISKYGSPKRSSSARRSKSRAIIVDPTCDWFKQQYVS